MPFQPGESGNPAGRPLGSRNKTTIMAEQLLDGEAEEIIRKLIDNAKKGEAFAAKLCVERLVPLRKGRAIALEVEPVASPADAMAAAVAIMRALNAGDLSAAEAADLAKTVEACANIVTITDLSERLARLEQANRK